MPPTDPQMINAGSLAIMAGLPAIVSLELPLRFDLRDCAGTRYLPSYLPLNVTLSSSSCGR